MVISKLELNKIAGNGIELKAVLAFALALFASLDGVSCQSAPFSLNQVPDLKALQEKHKQRVVEPKQVNDSLENKQDSNFAQLKQTELSLMLKEAEHALKTGETERALRIFTFASRKFQSSIGPILGIARVNYILAKSDDALKILNSIEEKFPLYGKLYALKGDILFSAGKLDEAKEELRTAVSLEEDSDSYYKLAQLSLLAGKRDEEAISLLRRALDCAPKHLAARVLLARLLWREEQLVDASTEMNAALALDPDNAQLLSELALILADRGKTLEAIEKLLQAYRIRPESAEIQKQLLTVYGMRRDWSSAQDAASSWLQLEPQNPKAHLICAWTMLMNHEFDDASQTLKQAIALSPNDPEIRNIYGIVLSERKKTDEAMAQFKAANSNSEGYLPSLLNLSGTNIYRGQFNEAREQLDKLSRDFPENGAIMSLEAYLETRSQNWERAILKTKQALELDQDDSLAIICNAIICRHQGKLDESIEQLRKISKLEPDSALALTELSTSYLQKSEPKLAIEAAQQALQLAPGNLEAKAALAFALSKEKNYDGAVLLLKECVSRNPKDLNLRMFLSEVQRKKGDIYLAEGTLNKTRALFPDRAEPLVGLAEIALEEKKYRAADELLAEALQYAPSNKQILELRARTFMKMGKAQEALDQLKTLTDSELDRQTELTKARCHFMLGDYANAQNGYARLIQSKYELGEDDLFKYTSCLVNTKDLINAKSVLAIFEKKHNGPTKTDPGLKKAETQLRALIKKSKTGSRSGAGAPIHESRLPEPKLTTRRRDESP